MMICRYMKGDMCAEQYCDFWSERYKKCISAIKEEAIAEFFLGLDEALLFNPEALSKLGNYNEMAEKIKSII